MTIAKLIKTLMIYIFLFALSQIFTHFHVPFWVVLILAFFYLSDWIIDSIEIHYKLTDKIIPKQKSNTIIFSSVIFLVIVSFIVAKFI